MSTMQELAESEVTIVEVEGELVERSTDGTLRRLEREANNPFKDTKAINAWQHRAMALLMGSRVSKHALGRAPRAQVIAKRRARAKVAKASRRANR